MLKVSRQMAFQWTQVQLFDLMTVLEKFISRPGIKDNFTEALGKFQIPHRTQEAWIAALQISNLMIERGKGLHEIRKVIVWKTEDPKKYDLEIDFLMSTKP